MNNEPSNTFTIVHRDRSGGLGAALRRGSHVEPRVPPALARLLDDVRAPRGRRGGAGNLPSPGALSASKENIMPRELIDTGTDKRFVRRDEDGKFSESDDVGRSLAQDQKRDSSTKPKRGEGDRGDR